MPFCFLNCPRIATFQPKQKTPEANRRLRGLFKPENLFCVTAPWRKGCSGCLAELFVSVALGDEGRAAGTAGPGHDGVFLGGCCDDTLDEAFVGFHGSLPRLVGLGRLPLLEDEYGGPIGPVFGD